MRQRPRLHPPVVAQNDEAIRSSRSAKLEEIQARALDPVALKMAWIEMSDAAEAKMIRVADERPELPIGVAFVDVAGRPGWIGDDSSLRLHAPSVRGCWPVIHGLEP